MELPSQPVLSKKRHMRGKESGAGGSGLQRRSEEIPHAGVVSGVHTQPPTSRPSFDSISLPSAGIHHQDSFPPNMQDLLPLDLSTRGTPESSGAGSAAHQAAYAGTPTVGTPSTLNRLGALMFPSEDPFAYPNQPMMELGLQQKMQQEPMQGQGQDGGQDSAQFFMQGAFDDMESHLLGQIPPFMIDQAQQGLEMPIYSSGMPSGSVPAAVPSQRGVRGGGGVGGQQGDRERMEQLRRQQEQIIQAQRYRDWGSYGRGNFQM